MTDTEYLGKSIFKRQVLRTEAKDEIIESRYTLVCRRDNLIPRACIFQLCIFLDIEFSGWTIPIIAAINSDKTSRSGINSLKRSTNYSPLKIEINQRKMIESHIYFIYSDFHNHV